MSLRVAIIYSKVPDDASPDRKGVETERDGVISACEKLGYEFTAIPIRSGYELERVRDEIFRFKPDCVFNLVEELDNNPIGEFIFANFLEQLGIPYTGSPPSAIFIGLHKHITKMFLRYNRIDTLPFTLIDAIPISEPPFGFPAILKLPAQDGSVGISAENIVFDLSQYRERANYMLSEFGAPVLVEKFVSGREFHSAFVGESLTATGEIEFKNGALVVCHKSKWEPGSIEDLNTPPYFPARVDPQKSKKIIRLGYSAFKAIGGRGYGRVDMREDSSGRLFVLEVNPNPDISPGAGFANSFRAKNIAYEAIIQAIIEDAIAQKERVNIW